MGNSSESVIPSGNSDSGDDNASSGDDDASSGDDNASSGDEESSGEWKFNTYFNNWKKKKQEILLKIKLKYY